MTRTITVTVTEMPVGVVPADVIHDPTLWVVRVLAPPDSDAAGLTDAIMDAMGRRTDTLGGRSLIASRWRFAREWLAAHRTEWLVVLSAQDVSARNVYTLVDVAGAAGTRLLLVADTGHLRQLRDRTSYQAVTQADWADALAVLPAPHAGTVDLPAGERSAVDRDLPPVADLPDHQWPSFRSRCRVELPARHAAAVETVCEE